MEEELEQIGSELGVRPNGIIPTIRSFPKAREMDEFRAQIAKLLKENADLQTQVADRYRKMEEVEAQAAAAVEERIWAEAEREKWHGVSRKFFDFVRFSSDMVTKARVFDQCMKKPEAISVPKILRMLVDFSGRVENLLKELRLLLQHDGRGQEAGPSERHPEPGLEATRPELASPPASSPEAPATGGPSPLTPRPEATQHQQEPTATPAISDPTHQEPISDSLNTNDIPSLHQWATEGLQDSATPATGSRGPIDPVVRITPGFVTRSQQR